MAISTTARIAIALSVAGVGGNGLVLWLEHQEIDPAIIDWIGIASIVLVAVGVILFIATALKWWRERGAIEGGPHGRWILVWNWPVINANPFPFRRLIPLRHAAEITYRKVGETTVADWAEHAARKWGNGSVEDIFSFVADIMVNSGDSMDVWGYQMPSQRLQKINPEIFATGTICDGGNAIEELHDQKITWNNLLVSKRDMKRRIREIKKGD